MTKKILLSLLLMGAMSASLIADDSENNVATEMNTTEDIDNSNSKDVTMDDADALGATEDMDIASEDMPDEFGELTDEQLQEIMRKLQENPDFTQELGNATEPDATTLDEEESDEDSLEENDSEEDATEEDATEDQNN